MVDLVLRPSGDKDKSKEYALQLRYADCGSTDYHTIALVSYDTASEIIRAGKAVWLFSNPASDEPAVDSPCLNLPEIVARYCGGRAMRKRELDEYVIKNFPKLAAKYGVTWSGASR